MKYDAISFTIGYISLLKLNCALQNEIFNRIFLLKKLKIEMNLRDKREHDQI